MIFLNNCLYLNDVLIKYFSVFNKSGGGFKEENISTRGSCVPLNRVAFGVVQLSPYYNDIVYTTKG